MLPLFHLVDYPPKANEVYLFLRFEGVLSKEFAHFFQPFQGADAKGIPISLVRSYDTMPKEALERIKHGDASAMLHYYEFGKHLIA